MNLLLDPWIPVRDGRGPGRIRYRDLLCDTHVWQLGLPRDDLELACLQLLVSLTQVIFLPEDRKALRRRIDAPLKPEEFDAGIARYRDWFDLDHPDTPFMQTRGVQASEPTPIQKLLAGLPEGNNHAFFNEPGEVTHLGAAGAAIALFNQAMNCPSFGGGFKGSLRGGAPITTLIKGEALRDTVWRNVLHRGSVCQLLPGYDETADDDAPTWVRPIKPGEKIAAGGIGLLRGLFWQPAHVELIPAPEPRPCGLLGGAPRPGYSGFNKEKFNFEVLDLWPHPHGPRQYSDKKGVREERYLSFTTTAPAWVQCSQFLFEEEGGKQGHTPAAVVSQYRGIGDGSPLDLIVGGYRNKQASILQRRHELFCIAAGWEREEMQGYIREIIALGLDARARLRAKLYAAVKGNQDKGIKGLGVDVHETAEELYYQRTEPLIHALLREMDPGGFRDALRGFAAQAAQICREIFEEVTAPYGQNPALIRGIALAQRGLHAELNKLQEGVA